MGTAMQPIHVEGVECKPKRRSRKSGSLPDERRANCRYELDLEFEMYQMRGSKEPQWCGFGRTRNWSRNSLLVQCNRPPAAGGSVQLNVRWTPGVQLVVIARVIRAERRGIVLRIERRRFRGKPALAVQPSPAARTPDGGTAYGCH